MVVKLRNIIYIESGREMKIVEVKIMRKILAIIVAMFFALSLVSVAGAAEKEMYTKDEVYSISGSVLAVDSAAKTLIVKSMEPSKSPSFRWKCDITFVTDDNTKIVMGEKVETFQDLKAGEKAVVEFHEKDGKYIADTIRISAEEHG